MMGYDAWLERPYQEAAERGEAMERMAEEFPGADDDELDRLVKEREEAAAEDAAERKLDAMRDMERDW